MAEAEIEIDLGNGIAVNGRIDMVRTSMEDGQEKTGIVDFKTASRSVRESINTAQLRIYALGYEVLTGKSADYLEVYHVDSAHRARREVTPGLTADVAEEIRSAADHIRRNDLPRKCSKEKCQKCRERRLCLTRNERREYGEK